MRRPRLSWLSSTAVVFFIAAIPRPADAARARKSALRKLEEGDAIRNRRLLRGGRFEVGPTFGVTLNDAYQRNILFGGQLAYHFNESWALGLTAFGGTGSDTGLASDVKGERPEKAGDGAFSNVGALGTLDVQYTPLIGKFALFGRNVFDYDLHLVVGVGGTQLAGDSDVQKTTVTPMLGLGVRTFLSDAIALNFEVRDYLYSSALNSVTERDAQGVESVDADSELSNNFAITFNFGFYFPRQPEIGD